MEVGVVGGGIAGLAAALAFHRLGHQVSVVERPSAFTEVAGIWGRTAEFGALPLPGYGVYAYGGARSGHADLDSYLDWPAPLPELIAAREPNRVITHELREMPPVSNPLLGRVVLIGDAAHALRPTFGQGAALALEDAVTLARLGPHRYVKARRRRTTALYWCSRWGSLITMPTIGSATTLRDNTLRAMPNRLFSTAAGLASAWKPPFQHDYG
ncbi:FAD-dependent monooxygenase [Mycobacterium kubicae]|nr:FAD-dependent monooxygenase [Mycobacterium kubicae]